MPNTRKRRRAGHDSVKDNKTKADPNSTAYGTFVLVLDEDSTQETNRHAKREFSENTPVKVELENKILNEDPAVHSEIRNVPKIKSGIKYIGAHVSISGGIFNSICNAEAIGARAFGLFLRNQQQWKTKDITSADVEKFQVALNESTFTADYILPHAPYLINLGSPNEETRTKSVNLFIDDLKRCELLGLRLYNFHPGSTCGSITIDECINYISSAINLAHKETKFCITILENMSCQGHTLGGKFEELRAIIDQVVDKERVGVCLDTCHAFAAGFNIKDPVKYEEMMQDFDRIVGLKFLKAIHLNDSEGDLGCHKDRHANIGKGKIGLKGFRNVMNDPRLNDIPMILETPAGLSDSKEIDILYSLCNKRL